MSILRKQKNAVQFLKLKHIVRRNLLITNGTFSYVAKYFGT